MVSRRGPGNNNWRPSVGDRARAANPDQVEFLTSSFIGSGRSSEFIDRTLHKVLSNVEKRVQSSIFDVSGPMNLLKFNEEMAQLPGEAKRG